MPATITSHPVGTSVIFRHEGRGRKAQVVSHDPVTGAVNGIAVYVGDGHPDPSKEKWVIDFGVPDPQHAETPQHEITDGFFHRAP